MSGHNKWSTIRRKKGKIDAQRGRIFTRLIKEITVAAREGGGDPDSNSRLRTAIAGAKAQNMPQDNITRAIKKGTGELPGVNYEDVVYEGYGPGGVAIMVEALTDNKNRTTPEIRHILSKYNGNLGATGCVSWMFEKKGVIVLDKDKSNEDQLLELLLDAEVEDIEQEDDEFTITVGPAHLEEAKKILEDNDIEISSSEITMVAGNTKELQGKEVDSMMKIMDALEDHDDVQKVHTNADFKEEDV